VPGYAADDRGDGCGGNECRGRGRPDERERAAAPSREDERERRRPLEARGGQSGRDILNPTRESAAGAAAAEMVVEQRRLELRQLAVDPQGRPPTSALAQRRVQFHALWDARTCGWLVTDRDQTTE
jgi:hypothetical protein